jgi:hypothetical protein
VSNIITAPNRLDLNAPLLPATLKLQFDTWFAA